MGRCPTNDEFGPGWGHLWVENNRTIKKRPGWGALWVDVQQMMNLVPDGVTYG